MTASVAPPILLFGMPRSGTTWIGKILDSHPDTLYRHEPDSWGLLNALPLMRLRPRPTRGRRSRVASGRGCPT